MKTVTTIKLDKKLKTEANSLADKLGLNLSIVINSLLKTFVNNQTLTFSIEPELNEKTKKYLQIDYRII
jgi:addiction module RelB/DinJ family antitoxin